MEGHSYPAMCFLAILDTVSNYSFQILFGVLNVSDMDTLPKIVVLLLDVASVDRTMTFRSVVQRSKKSVAIAKEITKLPLEIAHITRKHKVL